MPGEIGYGFAPFLDEEERRKRELQNGAGGSPVQEAIKILSLRVPTFGESGIAPRELIAGTAAPPHQFASAVGAVNPLIGGQHPGVPGPGTGLPPLPGAPPPTFTPVEPPEDGDIDSITGNARRGRRGGVPPGRKDEFGTGPFGVLGGGHFGVS